jgi:cytochrome c-type biogenesis protein CcmF
LDLQIKQTNPMDDFIVLKALVFPYINVLWLGVIVMVLGFCISVVAAIRAKALKEKRSMEDDGYALSLQQNNDE